MYSKNDWVVITAGYYRGERARVIKVNRDLTLRVRIGNGKDKDIVVPNVPDTHVRKA